MINNFEICETNRKTNIFNNWYKTFLKKDKKDTSILLEHLNVLEGKVNWNKYQSKVTMQAKDMI